MTKEITRISSLPSKKFYFLDYFFILLSSVEKNEIKDEVFNEFKILKQKHRLGESKYKKLEEVEAPTPRQQQRYRYTFDRVMDECKEYDLIVEEENLAVHLTEEGKRLLAQHRETGIRLFNRSIFELMENEYGASRTLVEFLYKANPINSGVLVFPHYSPLALDFDRRDIRTTGDLTSYTECLARKLQEDIKQFLGQDIDLMPKNRGLLEKITGDGLLSKSFSGRFDAKDYNKITKRIRDFWLTYFLRELYRCPYSMTSFDLWGYRARQIGVIQATESYPSINGKLVYPTSVVLDSVHSKDFSEIYHYPDDKRLFIHEPVYEEGGEEFTDELVTGYFKLRRRGRSNFVNLISLREIVCLRLKISMHTFEETLSKIYRLNLAGKLRIGISLEVDKLPEETSAMYMKHEPVMVDGSYRNIIAIDISKGGKKQ